MSSLLMLSPLDESIFGCKYGLKGLIAALNDSEFTPDLSSSTPLDSYKSSVYLQYNMLKFPYGPYFIYSHPRSSPPVEIEVNTPSISSNFSSMNWATTCDFAFTVAWEGDRLAISSNINTYSDPYTDAGDGWCGVCGTSNHNINSYTLGNEKLDDPDDQHMYSSGSVDHWYAQTGLNTAPDSHTGPITAATTLSALIKAHMVALEVCTAERENNIVIDSADPWLRGVRSKADLCEDNIDIYRNVCDNDILKARKRGAVETWGTAIHHENQILFHKAFEILAEKCLTNDDYNFKNKKPSNNVKIVDCHWIPLHWGGYSWHYVLLVVLNNGFLISICPLSLRIIQVQHPNLTPVNKLSNSENRKNRASRVSLSGMTSWATGIVVDYGYSWWNGEKEKEKQIEEDGEVEITYTLTHFPVKQTTLFTDNKGVMYITLHSNKYLILIPIVAVAVDLERRVLCPTVSGSNIWSMARIKTNTNNPINGLLPSTTSLLSTRLSPLSSHIVPLPVSTISFPPPNPPSERYIPIIAPPPPLPSTLITLGASISLSNPIPSFPPPTRLSRKVAAFVSYVKSRWTGETDTLPSIPYLAPIYTASLTDSTSTQTVISDAARTFTSVVHMPGPAVLSTSIGAYPIHAYQLLLGLLSSRYNSLQLYSILSHKMSPPMASPLLPFAQTPLAHTSMLHSSLSLITDSLGRVVLFDSETMTILHCWNGYRKAQVSFAYCVPVNITKLDTVPLPNNIQSSQTTQKNMKTNNITNTYISDKQSSNNSNLKQSESTGVSENITYISGSGQVNISGINNTKTIHNSPFTAGFFNTTPHMSPSPLSPAYLPVVLLHSPSRSTVEVWSINLDRGIELLGCVCISQIGQGKLLDIMGSLTSTRRNGVGEWSSTVQRAIWERHLQEVRSWPKSLHSENIRHRGGKGVDSDLFEYLSSKPDNNEDGYHDDEETSNGDGDGGDDGNTDEFFDFEDDHVVKNTNDVSNNSDIWKCKVLYSILGCVVISSVGKMDMLMLEIEEEVDFSK